MDSGLSSLVRLRVCHVVSSVRAQFRSTSRRGQTNMITIKEDFKDKYVCVLGLGYVGLTLALVMADAGFKVLGVEIRDDVLASLKKGRPHFFEPGLKELLERLIK